MLSDLNCDGNVIYIFQETQFHEHANGSIYRRKLREIFFKFITLTFQSNRFRFCEFEGLILRIYQNLDIVVFYNKM